MNERQDQSCIEQDDPYCGMSDYIRIASAIRFIEQEHLLQPTLEEVAEHVHLSPYHFQRLFSRWAGVSPKRFLQAMTVEHAKRLLDECQTLLDVSAELGLSSSSRLHDHFVTLEAVTPGEYRARGAGMDIRYGVTESALGYAFIAASERGICQLSFLEDQDDTAELARLELQWPAARLIRDEDSIAALSKTIFSVSGSPDRPLSLLVSGTNFQINVWRALLNIPPGQVSSYARVAEAIDRPTSLRAVGNAVGANPVAFLIPCHRVIHSSGKVEGYRWGKTRKQAMLAREACLRESNE